MTQVSTVSQDLTVDSEFSGIGRVQKQLTPLWTSCKLDARDQFAVKYALHEALRNAIIHGHEHNPTKQIQIHCNVDPEGVEITVRDTGAGFDLADIHDPLDPEQWSPDCGRGLLIMRTYMDRVELLESGNVVRMYRRRIGAVLPDYLDLKQTSDHSEISLGPDAHVELIGLACGHVVDWMTRRRPKNVVFDVTPAAQVEGVGEALARLEHKANQLGVNLQIVGLTSEAKERLIEQDIADTFELTEPNADAPLSMDNLFGDDGDEEEEQPLQPSQFSLPAQRLPEPEPVGHDEPAAGSVGVLLDDIPVDSDPFAEPTPLDTDMSELVTAPGAKSNEVPTIGDREAKEWFCQIRGQMVGPITADGLQKFLLSGELQPSDLCRKSSGAWFPVEKVPAFWPVRGNSPAAPASKPKTKPKKPNRAQEALDETAAILEGKARKKAPRKGRNLGPAVRTFATAGGIAAVVGAIVWGGMNYTAQEGPYERMFRESREFVDQYHRLRDRPISNGQWQQFASETKDHFDKRLAELKSRNLQTEPHLQYLIVAFEEDVPAMLNEPRDEPSKAVHGFMRKLHQADLAMDESRQ